MHPVATVAPVLPAGQGLQATLAPLPLQSPDALALQTEMSAQLAVLHYCPTGQK